MLPVLLIGPLVLLWVPMARTRRMRWSVAAGLAGLIAAAVLLAEAFPSAFFEIMLAALMLAASTVAVASAAEQRDPRPRPQRIRWLRTVSAGFVLTALCTYGALLSPAPFFPTADKVLPLPAGLRATVEPADDGDCGSGVCTRTITVAGRPGQSGDDLRAEVARHVRVRGWDPSCRPAGWLLDTGTECVELSAEADQVVIRLSGLRGAGWS